MFERQESLSLSNTIPFNNPKKIISPITTTETFTTTATTTVTRINSETVYAKSTFIHTTVIHINDSDDNNNHNNDNNNHNHPYLNSITSSTSPSIIILPTTIFHSQPSPSPSPLSSSSSSANSLSKTQTTILAITIVGSVGLVFILGILVLWWFRKGENEKTEAKNIISGGSMSDEGGGEGSEEGDGESNNDDNNFIMTYRPGYDDQLPSYAEAVVRGRSSSSRVT
ncbi:hypothetical protein Glove_606g95 [Diversispora epigaea]|uniref:Uncharacterized protein n=1 Tax=Diversispora epigaea TaxID=1348612 RepID=A0A397GB45_9GLOM|nr:hypothetical protein Glove_606g95 [Diversispora epigaea]